MSETENQEKIETQQETQEQIRLEAEYQRSLSSFRDRANYLLNNDDPRTNRLFDLFFPSSNQRSYLESVFGQLEIAQLEEQFNKLPPEKSQVELIDRVVEIVDPLIRRRFFDPEVMRRAESLGEERRTNREEFTAGQIGAVVIRSPWEFIIGEKTNNPIKIEVEDNIMEINWPEKSQWGLQAARESLKEVAKLLKDRPQIKAVVGISWMMSHPLSDQFGFEKFPNLPIDAGMAESSLGMVLSARKDKPQSSNNDPKLGDVLVGAISREEFIERFL